MLLTVQEYAERNDVGERMVRNLCERRELPAIRLGSRWLIEADAQAGETRNRKGNQR